MKKYPTPTARDFKDTTNCSLDSINPDGSDRDRRDRLVGAVVDRYGKPEKTMQLNPTWVEWLMGWPIGWTSMEPITELDWRDWETDPADDLPPEEWRSPAASEPGITTERLRPIEGGELGGMNRHFDKDTGRMAQIGITQQVKIRDKGCPGSIPRVATGIKHRVGRLKAIGNGQVPQVAELAWRILTNTKTP